MTHKHTLNSYNSQINISISELLPKLFLFLSGLSFVVSLFLSTFFTSDGNVIGAWVFILGWIGIVVFQFAWYANPLNILALLLFEARPRLAILLSLLALVIASETFTFSEIPTGLFTGNHSEKTFIKEFGLGFYSWYLSQILFLFALFSKYLATNKGNS
ncbi:hypothetical protein GCM10009133_30330 [Cocleimonas flava]|uniref:Uncharacterized protein n=1 Tax=Cocleimonas flava TaxID=634765 RepID=A0A4R1F5G1_9GAMM|nr:hypothetical protein [Cocleimonas flava]TCJ89123.1 hypothetical protein EV695_0984 [Cocleimonas flava]